MQKKKHHNDETKDSCQDPVLLLAWLKIVSKIFKPVGTEGHIAAQASLALAKFAAIIFHRLSAAAFVTLIEGPAKMKNKKFFIDLGKCLSGEIDTQLWDLRDYDMAEIILSKPRISAKDAVRELEMRNHHGITEENFRMWKMRFLKAKRQWDAFQAGLHELRTRNGRRKFSRCDNGTVQIPTAVPINGIWQNVTNFPPYHGYGRPRVHAYYECL